MQTCVKKVLRISLLIFFMCILIFAVWQLWMLLCEYRAGQDSYSALDPYVFVTETDTISAEDTVPASDNTVAAQMPDISAWPQVDFVRLSEINPDIVGWIYIEGTNIHYPVVQGADNSYYLKRLFDGSYNSSGCIFLDYRCAFDFSDRHSVIYGHHMNDGSMFAALMNYKNQGFYDEHSVALLVTPTAYYKIQLFSGYVSDTRSDAWDLSFGEQEYMDWLTGIRQRSCFETDYAPAHTDKIITLSTCTYEFDTAKFVLHGYISESIENIPPDI